MHAPWTKLLNVRTHRGALCAAGLACLALAPAASAQLLIPISTPGDLDLMRTTPGGDFYLTNDIDLTGVAFAPIGTVADPFTGTLDGAGHSIDNLTINACPEIEGFFDFLSQDRIGLFGVTDGASIVNLALVNASVVGDESVGTLIGQAQQTIVKNCSATGSATGRIQVGGLCGFFGDSTGVNSWADVDVDYCEPLFYPAKWHGGFVGHAHPYHFPGRDPSNTGDGCVFTNCYAKGDVHGQYVAGGFIGNFHGAYAENCFATGDVTADHGFSGGFAGYLQNEAGLGENPVPLITSLLDCHASGVVTSESFGSFNDLTTLGIWDFSQGLSPMPSNGGFVGYAEGGLDAEGTFPNVIIEQCTARGNVVTHEPSPTLNLPTAGFVGFTEIRTFITHCKATGDVDAANQTSSGGFVGWGEGVVEDSSAHGQVVAYNRSGAFGGQCSAIRNAVTGTPGPFGGKFRRCVAYGDFRSTDPTPNSLIGVGGFAGYLFSDVEITDCAAHGSVTTIGGWAGGFVGHASRDTIERCASFGPVFTQDRRCGGFVGRTRLDSGTVIRDCYSQSEVVYTGPAGTGAETELGGFIGSAEVGTSVIDCYSVGTVAANGTYVGGFVGKPTLITFSGCYYDTQASHQSGSQPSGVNARSTVQMRQQATFVGWDFAGVWDIVENWTYPFFQ